MPQTGWPGHTQKMPNEAPFIDMVFVIKSIGHTGEEQQKTLALLLSEQQQPWPGYAAKPVQEGLPDDTITPIPITHERIIKRKHAIATIKRWEREKNGKQPANSGDDREALLRTTHTG